MKITKKPFYTILLIWLAWAILVIGFQKIATMRFQPQLPDTVLDWTAGETTPGAHDRQPYLLDPFMNRQVAYDSEFYISIAVAGYDDPGLRAIWLDPNKKPEPIWNQYPNLPFGIPNDFPGGRPAFVPKNFVAYCFNYAFFPFYPLMIRALSFPLKPLGLDPIATAALAGVIVSLLGALGAMLALYDLTRDDMDDTGRLRTAFYLVAFPTGFFLAMVHTEGLFVGLAFGALALLKRKQWLLAALLAACATVTRAVGVALVIPFGIAWLQEAIPFIRNLIQRNKNDKVTIKFPWNLLWKGLVGLSPLMAYGIWDFLLGKQFRAVEGGFFSRGIFVFKQSQDAWTGAFRALFDPSIIPIANRIGWGLIALTVVLVVKILLWSWLEVKIPKIVSWVINLTLLICGGILVFLWYKHTNNEQRTFYYMVEFAATILALAASAYMLRTQSGIALFSLMVVLISFFSGGAQGMPRYILGAPAVFIMLGHLGKKNEAFDRAWTIGSVLLMGLFAMLFAFNFWVG
jgi:hypothetical protein